MDWEAAGRKAFAPGKRAFGPGPYLIATHSPILLAIPGAVIYELSEEGIERCAYDALDAVRTTRAFLDAPERFIRAALEG